MKSLSFVKFGIYTYLESIAYAVLALLPKIFRRIVFKFSFSSMGRRVFIDEKCYFRYPWKIKVGNDVIFNQGCKVYPSTKSKDEFIEILDGVIFGPNVTIYGAGQDPSDPRSIDVSGKVLIGANAYIGGNSIIRYGVTIGAGAVIGAGSVVVKNVPEHTIVAGNPAKVIRKIVR